VNALIEAYSARVDIYVDDPDANALLVGNGSNPLQLIAPGTNGQVLMSNGTAWEANDPPAATVDWASPGTIGSTAPNTGTFGIDAASTNSVLYPLVVRRTTSGTPANNIGGGIEFQAETSTTANQVAARISADWSTVTHASRTSRMFFYLVNNAASPAAALTLTPTRATIAQELYYTYGADHYLASPHDLGTNTFVSEKTNGNFTITGYLLRLYGTTGVDLRALGNNTITTRTNNVARQTIDGSGNYIINDTGTDSDFRIEGDTDANLFVLDAGLDRIGIGTNAPTAKFDVNSDLIRLRTSKTPATAGATGNAGDIGWDADFIYVCIATNTWKRATLASW